MSHSLSKLLASLILGSFVVCLLNLKAEASPQSSDNPLTIINFNQGFEKGSRTIESTPELLRFSSIIDSILRNDNTIEYVEVAGVSSIDGPEALNTRLAKDRAVAMAEWLKSTTSVDPSTLNVTSRGEDWDMLRLLVNRDNKMPFKEEILKIIASTRSNDAKEKTLRTLQNGEAWDYLSQNTFPLMRTAQVALGEKHKFLLLQDTGNDDPEPEVKPTVEIVEEEVEEEIIIPTEIIPEVEEKQDSVVIHPVEVAKIDTVPLPQDQWRRRLYIKTDLPYWLLTWSNLSVEVDLAPHLSINAPIVYSALDYFQKTTKFRIFGLQPGIRYWLRPDNKGVYLEAHYAFAYYDFAFNGKYRYQDYLRKTPAQGGGIAAGYRLSISKNGRWAMEFGGGIGVYKLHYDKFINEPNGKRVTSEKKTYFGLDNLNISISYSFPIEKKKGGNQ